MPIRGERQIVWWIVENVEVEKSGIFGKFERICAQVILIEIHVRRNVFLFFFFCINGRLLVVVVVNWIDLRRSRGSPGLRIL